MLRINLDPCRGEKNKLTEPQSQDWMGTAREQERTADGPGIEALVRGVVLGGKERSD